MLDTFITSEYFCQIERTFFELKDYIEHLGTHHKYLLNDEHFSRLFEIVQNYNREMMHLGIDKECFA